MSSSIFDWFHLIAANAWLYGGAFILVLSILVFVHEWGHYIVAKKCGVKIDSFSIGFGPELFGFTDKTGCRWKLSLIPMGGYVKMFGDVDPASASHLNGVEEAEGVRPLTASERKVAFFSQNVARRAAIVVAGPAINFLFAIVVMSLLFIFYGQPVTPPVAAAVIGGSAAQKAGFQPHDEIIAIDGKAIPRFEDIRREVMVGLDTPRIFKVKRGDKVIDIKATPERQEEKDRFGFKHTKGVLGLISAGNAIDIKSIRAVNGEPFTDPARTRQALVMLMGSTFTISLERSKDQIDELTVHPLSDYNKDLIADPAKAEPGAAPAMNAGMLVISSEQDERLVKYGPIGGIREALSQTWTVTSSTLVALGQMVTGTRSATELGGIIRIGAIAGDMAKSGFIALLTFTALLSINLGLINLFPIPMLDGGHLVFYAIEAVKGSPISEQIQEYAFRLGLVILGGIMIFANLNDLVQLVRH